MKFDLIVNLRVLAKEAAKKGEYHPEEHTCWLAAIRIEELEAMLDGKGDARLLHEIATRLWRKEQDERLLVEDRPDYNSKVKSAGTG